jgi:hypothetical protein
MRLSAFIVLLSVAALMPLISAPPNRFDAIDRHALNAPESAERSVQTLAKYLIRPARNDEEKARAIFRWITANISYDTRSYFTGTARPSSPNSVLRNKTAVCEGFSGLFETLGRQAGLEISTIGGYAKGYDSSVGDRFSGPSNHAWNAVRIDGVWRLMDATWGSGTMDENGRYVRSFNDYFFFTPPEQMIYTHFPENPEWQLLEKKVPLEDFEKLAYLRPGFFQNGLELESHTASDIVAVDTVRVTLRSPPETILIAQLLRNGKELGPDRTFVQKDGEKAVVLAAFPAPGIFVLRLFAKAKSDAGMAGWVLDYRIRARRSERAAGTYPESYQDFMDREGFLESPMQGRLKSGKIYNFSVRIAGAENAAVSFGKKWVDLVRSGSWFRGDVKAMKGEIHVFAKFPGRKQYRGLLKYTGY